MEEEGDDFFALEFFPLEDAGDPETGISLGIFGFDLDDFEVLLEDDFGEVLLVDDFDGVTIAVGSGASLGLDIFLDFVLGDAETFDWEDFGDFLFGDFLFEDFLFGVCGRVETFRDVEGFFCRIEKIESIVISSSASTCPPIWELGLKEPLLPAPGSLGLLFPDTMVMICCLLWMELMEKEQCLLLCIPGGRC